MTINELQNVVVLEGLILSLICVLIIAAFKRWKKIIVISAGVATIAAFSAWSILIALGSLLVYAPSSLLLWYELDKNPLGQEIKQRKVIRKFAWVLLATGVMLLIFKNIYNIYRCLN